jgi:serine phosphatase RsbU (regulator of sigma subunit)
MKLGIKITLAFFLVAFLSMLVIGIISYAKAREALQQEAFNRLTAVREMKADQIEDYFQLIHDQLITFGEEPLVVDAMKEFKVAYNSIDRELGIDRRELAGMLADNKKYLSETFLGRLNANLGAPARIEDEMTDKTESVILQNLYMVHNPREVGSKHLLDSAADRSRYTAAHARYHPLFRDFLEKFGYYDIFLIDDSTGNIVYTVFKEADFATSLIDGPFRETNLARSFRATRKAVDKEFVNLVDFAPYHPSYNQPASFISCPVFEQGRKIGILAFQLPIDRINDIMTSKQAWANVGLGATGETYIVGEDYTLRNQSRFLIEDSANYFKMLTDIGTPAATISKIRTFRSTVGLQEVKTVGTEEAIRGERNTRIFPDYRGVPVLSAYKPLHILNMHWVIMSEIDETEAFAHVQALRRQIIVGFLCLLVIVILLSWFVSRQITKPLKVLTMDALELARGNMHIEIPTGRKDEIGVLAVSFRKMQSSINKLVGDLRHINQTLEEKVVERTAEVVQQKDIIEHKQKEILDSIQYAKRIQQTILAHDDFLKKYLPEHFVLFKPKDIVSGDFYWATKPVFFPKGKEKFYLAVCDSTGHGVPGAFMSLLNIAFLNEAINEKKITDPHEVFNHVRKRLISSVSKDGAQDGMDGILLCLDMQHRQVIYSAAHNRPILIRNGEIIEHPADKMPIGMGVRSDTFTTHTLEVKKGDSLYLYTDGYADQFGGAKGKKFKYKNLNEMLLANCNKPAGEQLSILDRTFEEWKGQLEQIDDVCLVGLRF